MQNNAKLKDYTIRWPVILATAIIFTLILIAFVVDGESFYNVLNNVIMGDAMWNFGWCASIVALFMVIMCIVCMVTPIGRIKLGGPNAKPKFGYMQWFGISLCTGIGAGVVFWGSAEPLIFLMEPSPSTGIVPGSNEATLWSMVRCYMHWGFTAYATCIVMGVLLSYMILNKKAPFRTSSCLIPIFGEKVVESKVATVFDTLCALAMALGVGGGLGYGAMQLSAGIDAFAGIDPSPTIYAICILIMFVCYNASAVSGLRNGITWLSNKNTQLFFALLIFAFVCGPTSYICNLFTESFGSYLNEFFYNSLNTAPYPDSANWPQNWDMYWWVDWFAFTPILGLFMVRVAYGRTIREFVLIEWVAPAMFGIIWFAVFGGTIIDGQVNQGVDFYSLYLEKGAEALTLATFDVLPLTQIGKVIMLIVITISLVTQCDSVTVTLAGMSVKGSDDRTEAPVAIKLIWGVILGGVALIFTVLGGIDGIKTIKSFMGIPFTFICFIIALGFLVYFLKRPRTATGDYVYEDECANDPDNGEPMAPKSKFKFFKKLGF